MGAGKGTHRKKRISKHVIKANEKRTRNEDGGNNNNADQDTLPIVSPPVATTTSSSNTTKSNGKKTTKKQKRHTKDPAEVLTYLSSWKHRNAGTNWKFNKNTQSWIVRHMYEPSKVNKETFTLLIEYLIAGNDSLKSRVRTEAVRRARRYKEYEKTLPKSKSDETDQQQQHEGNNNDGGNDVEGVDEISIWNALNDHDKRKEYKRARKILDAIKLTD